MTNPNPSGGGMPKWLIILLVILLVMILGCCGGVTMCFFAVKHAAPTVAQHVKEEVQKAQDAAAKAEQEQAARNGGAPMVDGTPIAPTGGGTGSANATPSAAPSGMMSMSKMPKNFPTDIPVLNGLTPFTSTYDGVANKGMVGLRGNVKADDVVTYYTQALEKTGYTQASNTNANDITQLVYTKDALQVSVLVTPGESGAATSSNVVITYGSK